MSFVATILSYTLAIATVPIAEHEFNFVVLGDSQFHDAPAFNRIIDDVRALRPAFAIQVGDMISGYTDDEQMLRGEWRRFQAQIGPLLDTPFIPVPGNHDLYGANKVPSQTATDIYEALWGPTYHSFTYKNARFIVLNSDGVEGAAEIGGRQWQWLQNILQSNESQHVFVFLHRPPSGLVNAKALHALFKEHGVGHVFYGHHHHYHQRYEDGIRYIMANAAANSGTSFDEAGSFDHMIQVAVRDGDVSIAVIKSDSLVALDAVAPEDNYQLFSLIRRLTNEEIPARRLGRDRWQATLELSNPTGINVTIYTTCSSPDNRWYFSPRRIPALTLKPREQQKIELEWWFEDQRRPEGTPTCTLTVPFQTSQGSWLQQTINLNITSLRVHAIR